MSGGIDHGEGILGGLELPQSDINCDTTLTLSLEVVKHPSVLERSLANLGGLLLVLLDGAGIDVSNDDEGNVNLVNTGGKYHRESRNEHKS